MTPSGRTMTPVLIPLSLPAPSPARMRIEAALMRATIPASAGVLWATAVPIKKGRAKLTEYLPRGRTGEVCNQMGPDLGIETSRLGVSRKKVVAKLAEKTARHVKMMSCFLHHFYF